MDQRRSGRPAGWACLLVCLECKQCFRHVATDIQTRCTIHCLSPLLPLAHLFCSGKRFNLDDKLDGRVCSSV
ncbi:hypothetical protein J6590_103777 [Homalodisca vitripennis]|nr:hypothetical protein J6590_103777 [Homalodisca vitripennis]